MKDQKISRKNLAVIYKSVCDGWQKKIANLLVEQQTSADIVVSGTLLQEAYNVANADQKKMMEKYFKIQSPTAIADKYNTWEKIKKVLPKAEIVLPFAKPTTLLQKSINARVMLAGIIKIYNGDHQFKWNDHNQYKYFIYRYFPYGGGLPYCHADLWCDRARGPVDLAIKDRETAEKIIANFPEILKDYFMM